MFNRSTRTILMTWAWAVPSDGVNGRPWQWGDGGERQTSLNFLQFF